MGKLREQFRDGQHSVYGVEKVGVKQRDGINT